MDDIEFRLVALLKKCRKTRKITIRPGYWGDKKLAKALCSVWRTEMSVLEAEETFGIPYKVLRRYIYDDYREIPELKKLQRECLKEDENLAMDLSTPGNNNPSTGTNLPKLQEPPLLSPLTLRTILNVSQGLASDGTGLWRGDGKERRSPPSSSKNNPSTGINQQKTPEPALPAPDVKTTTNMSHDVPQPACDPSHQSFSFNFPPNFLAFPDPVDLEPFFSQLETKNDAVTISDGGGINLDDVDG